MKEFTIIKENLKWKCPIGNDPTYCPHGCVEKTEPCKEITRINNKLVHKCPHKRRFEQLRDSRPLPPNDEKDLDKMTKYFKRLSEWEATREREWDFHFEQCQECAVYDEWLESLNYRDECSKYRNTVWKMYLLNSRKARLWNNELR